MITSPTLRHRRVASFATLLLTFALAAGGITTVFSGFAHILRIPAAVAPRAPITGAYQPTGCAFPSDPVFAKY